MEDKCTVPVTFEKKESLQKTAEKAFKILEPAENIPEVEHTREILKSILEDYVEITDSTVKERKKGKIALLALWMKIYGWVQNLMMNCGQDTRWDSP